MDADCKILGEHLASPLMCRVNLCPSKKLAFCIENPSDNAVVDRDSDERAEDLGEKDGPRWYMHIMAQFLILKHDLGSIPSVTSNRPIYRSASRVLVTGNTINHKSIDDLIS